ncbi:YoaK family protein [Brachybacterium sp. DNPG3]
MPTASPLVDPAHPVSETAAPAVAAETTTSTPASTPASPDGTASATAAGSATAATRTATVSAPAPAPSAVDADRMHLILMLALTFSTGIVDAVGYLGLDRVFTANMTGNVVILGLALTGAGDLPLLGPVLALVGFVLGAMIAGRALGRRAGSWSNAVTALFVGVAVAVIGIGTVMMLWESVPHAAMLAVTGTLGLSMGAQAATARSIGVKDVTTVVLTSTITSLSMDSYIAGGSGELWQQRLLAVVLMLAGAILGALTLRIHPGIGLFLAGAICLVVAIIGQSRLRTV